MSQSFAQFAQTGMNKAHKLGASDVELFIMKNKALDLQVKKGEVEEIKVSENQGIGIRVIKNQQLGFSFSSDFSTTALDKMVTQAIANAKYSDVDPFLLFPKKQQTYPDVTIYDQATFEATLEDKVALAKETESLTMMRDQRVSQVERAGYEDGEGEVWIANSNGLMAYQKGSYCGIYCLALGSDGSEQQSGYGMDVGITFDCLSPEKAASMAAERAVRLLGAQAVATQVADVILEPSIACQIIGLIASGFSGEAVLKGRALFGDKLGQLIASPYVTLIDDGTLPNQLGTTPFDGEGVCSSKTVLVEQGVLKNYLYNTYYAHKADTVSTGNGMRGSFKGTPSIGTTNYYLDRGKISVAQLIGQVGKGLYVTEILGAHTANPISGDFSFGASGLWIEKGKFAKPVRGITIAGNFKTLLININGVADDLTFYGSTGAPTIKIAKVSISGT